MLYISKSGAVVKVGMMWVWDWFCSRIRSTPDLCGRDADRLLKDLDSVECPPEEKARRLALAKSRREEMMRSKQASRDVDAHALQTGEKTNADLWRENSLIPPRSMKVDFKNLRKGRS